MISLAVLPYVPKTKDNCCCEDPGPPLDMPIEYYILSVVLMIVVVIFVYRYLRKEGGLDEGDWVGTIIFTSPLIFIPGLNSFVLILLAIIATVWLLFSAVCWFTKKKIKISDENFRFKRSKR